MDKVSLNFVTREPGDGIYVSGGVDEVVANSVHDNEVGIFCFSNSSALFENNTIYDNSGAGMNIQGNTLVDGNTIYGNTPGILANSGSAPVGEQPGLWQHHPRHLADRYH